MEKSFLYCVEKWVVTPWDVFRGPGLGDSVPGGVGGVGGLNTFHVILKL